MKMNKRLGILVVLILIIASVTPVVTTVMAPPGTPHGVYGRVNANATTGVRAYSTDVGKNGQVTAFIQDKSDQGLDDDVVKYNPPAIPFDHYWNEIEDNIPTWAHNDPCVVIVDYEEGDYASANRSGYVAYVSALLDEGMADQQFPDTELRKIPVPQFTINGTTFINLSWTPLDNTQGLIAGYTVWRSDTNDSDMSWSEVSGGGAITDPFFNDTNVAADSMYYYAVKVVYAGTPNNIPGMFLGEGSSLMWSKSSSVVMDLIQVEYVSNGTVVDTIVVDVGMATPQVVAQGYNKTTMTPTGAVNVDWNVDLPALGIVSPASGIQTAFTANFTAGTVVITADDGTYSDSFNVTINPPQIDFIILTYTNGTEITDGTIWYMENTDDIVAQGYNNTGLTLIGPIEVDWTVTGTGGGSVTPAMGDTTTFKPLKTGVVTIMGENTTWGINDTVALTLEWLAPPQIDELRLTDFSGNNITDAMPIGGVLQIYAYGFNSSEGASVGPVEVTWEILTGDGVIDVTSGTSTNYTAGLAGGTVTIKGSNATLEDELIITISDPTVDYIKITDGPDGTELVTELISTVGSVTAYASGYNYTGDTYVDLVDVDWTDDPISLGGFSPTSGNTTTYTADAGEGTVNVTAEYAPGVTDNFTVDIQTFTRDFIRLTDEPNGEILTDITLIVGESITIYASGFHNTAGYTGLVDVDWSQSPDTIGTFSVETASSSTVFTAGNAGGTTSITGSDGVESHTLSLTILPPTVDSIMIRNASGGLGVEVTTDSFDLGGEVFKTYHCAGYNDTSGFVGPADADWTVETLIGIVNPLSGTSTQFEATAAGSGTLTCNFSGLIKTVAITVTEEVDTTSPAPPTGLDVTVDGTSIKLQWTTHPNTDGDLAGYFIYRSTSADSGFVKLNSAPITDTEYTDSGLDPGTYYYKITAVDNATIPNESDVALSTAASGEIEAAPPDDDDDEEFPMIILVIIIVVIVVVLLLFLMTRKKKPVEAVPPEEEKKELPPPPGGAAEVEEEEAIEEGEEVLPPEDETPEEGEGEEPSEEEGEPAAPEEEAESEEKELPPPPGT
jgi:hypothetical protein